MLLAAMLAMVLAAAAPAFAQAVVEDDGNDGNSVQYVDCSQVQAAVQAQYGDANAAADDESIAEAGIAQGLTQSQINACLGEINVGNVGSVSGGDDGGSAASDDSGSASASASSSSSASAAAEGELPETGGASLLALGAGALLVAGGLLARRIVR